MQDLLAMISSRQRPPLLVRAARHGLDDYDRSNRLPRILGRAGAPRIGEAILLLLEREADLETRRIARAAEYLVAQHVDVLTALMGEARLLRAGREAANTPTQPVGETGGARSDLHRSTAPRPIAPQSAAPQHKSRLRLVT